jgi:myo-inositol-1(or 4)-monophosphatase
MAQDWASVLQHTIPIVQQAGAYILSEWGKVTQDHIQGKSDNSLVSYVDRNTEMLLVEKLSALLRESTFLTEEGTIENRESPLQWIIDPLDGTTNFLYGIPHFVVSVGLQVEGDLKVGVIFDPVRKETFTAFRGGGARLNGEIIRVSRTTELKDALLSAGLPCQGYEDMASFLRIQAYFMRHTQGLRRLGAAALDMAHLACGRFDGFFEYCIHPWDMAAGILLIEEAGGRVGDFQGKSDCLYSEEVLAATPALFPHIEKAIQEELQASGRLSGK